MSGIWTDFNIHVFIRTDLRKRKKASSRKEKGFKRNPMLPFHVLRGNQLCFDDTLLNTVMGSWLYMSNAPFDQRRVQWSDWGDSPPKTYESNCFHHDFEQFGKQCSWYKAILSSIVLSQQCCAVCFIPFTVAEPIWDLTSKYHWNRPLTLLAGSAPAFNKSVETVATP